MVSRRHLDVFTSTLAMNLEPVYGIILGAVVFHENQALSTRFYVGTLVIVGTVCVGPVLSTWWPSEEGRPIAADAGQWRSDSAAAVEVVQSEEWVKSWDVLPTVGFGRRAGGVGARAGTGAKAGSVRSGGSAGQTYQPVAIAGASDEESGGAVSDSDSDSSIAYDFTDD